MARKDDKQTKSHAKLELQIAFSPFFWTINHGQNRPAAIIRREHANGWIEFRCVERLGIFDESVALSIIYLANDRDRSFYLQATPETPLGQELRKIMDPDNVLKDKAVGMVKNTDLNEIAHVMGYKRPNERIRKQIKESIVRLGSVIIRERDNTTGTEYGGAPGFIRYIVQDDGKLAFVIAHRLAMAAFGEKGWKFALVNLDERNKLGGDIAKTVHKWLTAWYFDSKSKKKGPRYIGLDTLAQHVWHEWDDKEKNGKDRYTPSGKRTLRQKLREAIDRINELPCWSTIVEGIGSKATVRVERLEAGTVKIKDASESKDQDEEDELPPYTGG